MKDPYFVWRRKNSMIKLVVSFNGAFRRRSPSGRLRYSGGETKIVSVDRSIGVCKLKARVLELMEQSNGVVSIDSIPLCSLKFHISGEDRPLVSISSDEDFRALIEEFGRLEFLGKNVRLWVFVCFDLNDDIDYCCFSDNGLLKNRVFSVKTGNEGLVIREKGNKKLNDNSLRKIVLKQQWLVKRSDRVRCKEPVIDISSDKDSFECENFSSDDFKNVSKSESLRIGLNCMSNRLLGQGNIVFEKEDDVADVKSLNLSSVRVDRENVMPFDTNMELNRCLSLSSINQLNSNHLLCQGNLVFEKVDDDSSGRLCRGIADLKYSNLSSVGVDRENVMPFNSNMELNRCLSLSQAKDVFGVMEHYGNVRLDRRQCVGKHWSISHSQRINIDEYGSVREFLDEQNKKELVNGNKKCDFGDVNRFLPMDDGSSTENHESFSDMCYSLDSMNREEVVHPCHINVRELSCDSFQNSIAQESITSSIVASLNNLSLSSTKAELQTSSHARSCGAKSLVKTESKDIDQMDEKDLSSGPSLERSNGASSNSLAKTPKLNYFEDSFHEKSIKKSELEYIKELGSGTFGTVYHGKWNGSDVAIKKLKPSCFTDGTVEDRLVADFWKEAHILGRLHHPNIVALYGVVTDGPANNLATVTEYMVNGSLKQVLHKKDRTIDCRKRLIIAMDAAFGMEYLHQKNVVHFDLKSHNFLVNMRDPQRPVCKIGDLGLSKVKQRTLVSGGVRGTIPWMAPELLKGESMVSEKVDVYSFGIVMWELLTGEEPYSNMRAEEIICGIIKGSLRPEIPNWCNPAWRSLMERCWSADPKARPAFSDIAKELRAMASAMNIK